MMPHMANFCGFLVKSNELPHTTHEPNGKIENGSHPLNGWQLEISTMGNWAEPNEWKNCAGGSGRHCYSKESKGMYPIEIFIYMTLPYVWIINVQLAL